MFEAAPARLGTDGRRDEMVRVASGTVVDITPCDQVTSNAFGFRHTNHSLQQTKTVVEIHMLSSKPVESVKNVTDMVKLSTSR